jgi:hypothetical protein
MSSLASLVDEIQVNAEGEVLAGRPGYHWYRGWFALATSGPTAAEYLLGGATVPRPALVALAGVKDACRHQTELPGQPVAEDWCAWAWWFVSQSESLARDAGERLGVRAAIIYGAALRAAVGRLIMLAPPPRQVAPATVREERRSAVRCETCARVLQDRSL